MKILRTASEQEMVASFVQAEISSPRHKKRLAHFLKDNSLPRSLFAEPDISSTKENRLRAKALGVSRGYGKQKALFEGYPAHVEWFLVQFTAKDLQSFRYLNHPGPIAFTAGSRKVADLDFTWCKNHQPFFVTAIEGIKKRIGQNQDLPPIIIVSTSKRSKKIVIIEGNTRATAISLLRKRETFEALWGISADIKKMAFW